MIRRTIRRFATKPSSGSTLWKQRPGAGPIQSPHVFSNEKSMARGLDTRQTGLDIVRSPKTREAVRAFFSTWAGWTTVGMMLVWCAAYYYLGRSDLFTMKKPQKPGGGGASPDSKGLLPKKARKYNSRLTVVLDLDETIVSYGDKAYRLEAPLVPRPFLAEFLDYLVEIDCEVVLWTAGSDRYARQVLNTIDPSGVRISQLVARDSSWFDGTLFYEKNVEWLGREMKNVLIVENRALAVRSCNNNAILVEDFIRAEYMDTGKDYPQHDRALFYLKEIIKDLHESGRSVPEYLQDKQNRHKAIKSIPCHLAVRQMPDELAVGQFHFVGSKYKPAPQ